MTEDNVNTSQVDRMSIFEEEAKRGLVVELQRLASEDLDTLVEASACALSYDEAKKIGIIARIIEGKSYDFADVARLYYYSKRELPAKADLLKAEILLLDFLKNEKEKKKQIH